MDNSSVEIPLAKFTKSNKMWKGKPMVLIVDGNSEYVAHP